MVLPQICNKFVAKFMFMASQSTYNDIKRHVELSERGTLFFPDTFTTSGSSDAVRSALVRLCENNVLIRVAQGIYYYPKIDTKWGSGLIPPSIEEIAKGIAKRDKVRIAPTGSYALYQLGLSTQIPANVVFITDQGQGNTLQAHLRNADIRLSVATDGTCCNCHARDWRGKCDRRADGNHQDSSGESERRRLQARYSTCTYLGA